MDTLVRSFSPLFPPAQGSVSLVDWDRKSVEQVQPFSGVAPQFDVPLGCTVGTEHPWCEVVQSGQAFFASHGHELAALSPAHRTGHAPTTPFALAVIPLPLRQRAHGILTLEVPGEHTFDHDEQAFLLSLAALAGQALDRALLHIEQQTLHQALEERNIELRGYAYALSHNLGEPVQRVWNFLKLAEKQLDGQLDSRTHRLFELARLEAEQITERIEELRTLALIERQTLSLVPLDLTVLLVQVRYDLEPLTRTRKVQWQVQPLPKVQGDALLLWQVLMELLAFAVEDAWEAEQPIIRVEAREEGGEVVLLIQSNGQGFSEALNERVFQVLDHSVPRKTAFGRLGLSNVRRALGRQEGRVRAQGRPGEGVLFAVTLPWVEEEHVGVLT